jgi:pyridoxine kinase
MRKRIVSVQDISCIGQCSLTVALPVLSSLGIETAVIPTAVLSSHTAMYEDYSFCDLTEEIPKILKVWKDNDLKFDGLYSGYLGTMRQTDYVLELYKNIRSDNFLFMCDPVMADNGKFYSGFTEDYLEKIKELAFYADCITPNVTEAEFLSGNFDIENYYTEEDVFSLCDRLVMHNTQKVIITGIPAPNGKLAVCCLDAETGRRKIYYQKHIKGIYHGTGDIFASVAAGLLLNGKNIEEAAEFASDFVSDCIDASKKDKEHSYGVHFEEKLYRLTDIGRKKKRKTGLRKLF